MTLDEIVAVVLWESRCCSNADVCRAMANFNI